MTALTTPQRRILEVIERLNAENGRPPSYRELMAELGYRSTGSVYRLVQSLKKKGYIQKAPRSWRSALPITQQQEPTHHAEVEIIGHISRQRPPELLQKPFRIPIPTQLTNMTASIYGLTVQDASFLEEHLLPGDLVIVEPTETIDPGELVLASTHQSIIGHFFDEGPMIRFRSSPYAHNPSSQTIPSETVQVWGVITGLIRSFTSSFTETAPQ